MKTILEDGRDVNSVNLAKRIFANVSIIIKSEKRKHFHLVFVFFALICVILRFLFRHYLISKVPILKKRKIAITTT